MDARAILSSAPIYRSFRRVVTRERRDRLVFDLLGLVPGQRLLDIGCGTGDALLNVPPSVEYVGVDVSPTYISAARARYERRGSFHVLDVSAATSSEIGHFDCALADGVLHHLDGTAARQLLSLATSVLKPGGRLVTIDPCLVPNQTRLARRLIESDRGEFVRTEPQYLELAGERFLEVRGYLRHDLLRLPYSHLLMECQHPRQLTTRPAAPRLDAGETATS